MGLSARTVLRGRACVRIFSAHLADSGNAFEQRAIRFKPRHDQSDRYRSSSLDEKRALLGR